MHNNINRIIDKASCCDSESSFYITDNGKAASIIVIGRGASPSEKHAAQELKKYIKRISGADLIISVDEEHSIGEGNNLVLIGTHETNNLIRQLIDKGQVVLSEDQPGLDGFVIKTVSNCLVLGGSRNRGTIYSVYHLLEKFFNVGFFWDGDSIHETPTMKLPMVNIFERPAFKFRFSKSGSECNATYSFTIWWGFDEWKTEIDWMMKSRINLAVIKCGESYIKKKTYEKMGIPHKPISEEDIKRMEIAKQVYDYCRLVDIDVVNHFHNTGVPAEFKDVYPEAQYFKSRWDAVSEDDIPGAPGLNIYPWDPVYKKLVETYINTWKETYGDIHMHIGSLPVEAELDGSREMIRRLFTEGPTEEYEAVKSADPEGYILFDGWMTRYDGAGVWDMDGAFEEFVDSMPEEKSIFIDLWPEWKLGGPLYKEKKFEYIKNRNFLLTFLNEFGGNDYLHGCYDTAIREVKDLLENENAKKCVGVGNSTEVMYFNVNYYDLMFKLAWNPSYIDKESFLDSQVMRRYGPDLYDKVREAYGLFIDAVHTGQNTSEAYYQRRILLHPYGYRSMPRSFSKRVIQKLERFFDRILPIPEEGKNNIYLQYDLYDAMRQYITELTNVHIYEIHDAFWVKRKDLFEPHAEALLFLMQQLEELVKSNQKWHIDEAVKKFEGRVPDDPACYEIKTAKDLGRWIRDIGLTFAIYTPGGLLDYPGKDYYELIKYYYRPRVEIFVDHVRKVFDRMEIPSVEKVEKELVELYRPVEVKWVNEGYEPINVDAEIQPIWQTVENTYRNIKSNQNCMKLE